MRFNDEAHFLWMTTVDVGMAKYVICDNDRRPHLVKATMNREVREQEGAFRTHHIVLNRIIAKLRSQPEVSQSDDVNYFFDDRTGELTKDETPPLFDGKNDGACYYPPFAEFRLPDDTRTVRRHEMVELDRLAPWVDLVRYIDTEERVVFKQAPIQGTYSLWQQIVGPLS